MKILSSKSFFISIYLILCFSVLVCGLSNFEEYESIVSAIIAQEYYPASCDLAFFDVNLFVIPLISKLNAYLPGYQLYAYYVYFMTVAVGAFLIHLIIKNARYTTMNNSYLVVGFIVLFLPNIFVLSTTRAVVILFIAIMYSYRYRLLDINTVIIIYVFCLFARLDAVLILSFFYLIISSLLDGKVTRSGVAAFACAITTFITFNLVVYKWGSDPFKVFYFYELDIFDRSNIEYSKLTLFNADVVELYKRYFIFDYPLYDPDFVRSILKTDVLHVLNSLLNTKLYVNTFVASLDSIKNEQIVIIATFFIVVMSSFHKNFKTTLILVIAAALPSIILFYVIIPPRFIYPYYSSILFISLFMSVHHKTCLLYLSLFICTSFINIYSNFHKYSKHRAFFHNSMNRYDRLVAEVGEPIVFENFYHRNWMFTTPDVLHVYKGLDAHFLNFGFFAGFSSYEKRWNGLGCKNSLSLSDKLTCVSENDIPLILQSEEIKETYTEYIRKYYNIDMPSTSIIK